MEKLPKRKPNRLKSWNYNNDGAYFITICVKERKQILSKICVGGDDPGAPYVELTPYGYIVDKNIKIMNCIYNNIKITDYVIMPNHIHFIIHINNDGRSGAPAPTLGNSTIPRFVSALKRFCNKEYGENIWQRSYYDHIIRNEADYIEKWNYIETNPIKWSDDEYYSV